MNRTATKKAAPERNSAATEKGKPLVMNNITPSTQKASGNDTKTAILRAAEFYLKKGYSVLPVSRETKNNWPQTWKEYQTRRMTPAEFTRCFEAWTIKEKPKKPAGEKAEPARAFKPDALAVICGAVSGNLVILDFDNHHGGESVFEEWKSYVCETEAGRALFARLVLEQSQSGGVHVPFRLTTPPGSKQELAKTEDGGNAVIEALGEAHFALCPPTPGYKAIQGCPGEYPTITPDEWGILATAAAQCDKRPLAGLEELLRHERKSEGKGWAVMPGKAYSARENALEETREMLIDAGWTPDGGTTWKGCRGEHFTRPGKDAGTSATLFEMKTESGTVPLFHVFTSNGAPFEAGKTYDPFGVYAQLNHNGDTTAAAAALHAEGYGEKGAASKKTPGINELAAGFLAEWDAARTVNGGHCLKKYRGAFYEFCRDSGWREISGEDLGGHIAEYLWKRKVDATAKRQSDIKAALGARNLCLLPSDTETPFCISTGESLDRSAVIPVKNGALRIPNGAKSRADLQLDPLTEDIFSPYSLPVPYEPTAETPAFTRYLRDVLPREADRETVRRMFGYALTPDRRLQVFFILYGPPHTGKSRIIETFDSLFGENLCSHVPYEQLGEKFGRAALTRALVNCAAELRCRGEGEEFLKQAVDGGRVHVEEKFKEAYDAAATALLVFASNNPPKFRDKTGSVWRRLRLLLFEIVIGNEEKDAALQSKINRELSGVLNFALDGLLEIRELNAFPENKSGKEFLEELRELEDPIPEALEACIVEAPGAFLESGELYGRLRLYLRQKKNLENVSDVWLAVGVKRALGIKGSVPRRNGQRGFPDIALKQTSFDGLLTGFVG
ncbi:MAG: bifunctional DNA primase/polymerase [Lentisphaeria bacterium]|nr:bifunctional DNA primase/polymerase [Lentisphaeria bacterium]